MRDQFLTLSTRNFAIYVRVKITYIQLSKQWLLKCVKNFRVVHLIENIYREFYLTTGW